MNSLLSLLFFCVDGCRYVEHDFPIAKHISKDARLDESMLSLPAKRKENKDKSKDSNNNGTYILTYSTLNFRCPNLTCTNVSEITDVQVEAPRTRSRLTARLKLCCRTSRSTCYPTTPTTTSFRTSCWASSKGPGQRRHNLTTTRSKS